ncbi:MAG: serine hydrolase domain-containing protein, partial [Bacteroidota bacterium]
MKQHLTYIFALLLLMSACNRTEVPLPASHTNCQLDYSSHPQHAQYSQILDRFTGASFVGMSLLIDHPQEDLWVGSSGWADIENEVAMTNCHLQHAASIIKTYIAVIILQMEAEGKLDLDEGMAGYVPDELLDKIPNGRTFTIRHLLQCRSGMPDTFEAEFLLDFLNAPTRQYSMEELMEFLYGVEAVGAPGERFYYGDGNFILLSMLIERLEGPLSEVFQSRIFDRLGMGNSHLLTTPEAFPDGVTASYWDRHGNGVIENVSEYQIALAAGLDGTDGLLSTVHDLNLFQRGLHNGNLLPPAQYAEMMETVDIGEGESSINYAAYG